jgi:uncharacterized protein YhfF
MEAVMEEYDFFAIAEGDGWTVKDRWRLRAESFSDACIMAQTFEDDPDILYTEFVEVNND